MTDPTPTEWGVRYPSGLIVTCGSSHAAAKDYARTHGGSGTVVRRPVAQWIDDDQNEPQPVRGATNPAPSDGGQGDTAENPPTGLTAQLVEAVTGIVAITPSCTGSKIHLELPGYQPGAKPRSGTSGSMCGAFVHRAQARVPLAEARDWPGHSCSCACARGANWNWCRACLGHAAAVAGIANQVITLVLTAPS